MKTIHVVFEDEEFEVLVKVKGKKSWHNFILTLTEVKKS
jgi:predicted CopG family antitoxin